MSYLSSVLCMDQQMEAYKKYGDASPYITLSKLDKLSEQVNNLTKIKELTEQVNKLNSEINALKMNK